MATFELYRRSTIGTCLTETLDELVSSGAVSPELAIQVLVQFDKVCLTTLQSYGSQNYQVPDSNVTACF
jgi:transcription initiation factor TFIIA small subunit